MKKVVAEHQITEVHYLSEGNYILRFKSPVEIPSILPGNFAEIQIANATDVFLRRPFSILDVDYENRIISFYVKVIGKGTSKLVENQLGDKVNLMYPLGDSYSIASQNKNVLIVGGGSGIAPFILLGKELKQRHIQTTFLVGGKSKKDILLTDEFAKYGDVLITTEDGSLGETGLVTSHSVFRQKPFGFDTIYTCGPDAMMKAIAKLAMNLKVECEASLENMMGCGFGVCLCCVTATQEGNKRVCWEGPVFNVNYLKWQT